MRASPRSSAQVRESAIAAWERAGTSSPLCAIASGVSCARASFLHALAATHGADHPPLLPDVDAAALGVIEEGLVEHRALHLECVVAIVLPGIVEREAILAALRVVVKASAVLVDEGRGDLVKHTDG